jgi:hypothetical protein
MKRSLILLPIALLAAASPLKAAGEVEACALVSKSEAAAVFGEIKGDPVSKDGLRGKKCSYSTTVGAWVTIELYSAEAHWELMKNMALDLKDLTGFGDEAFSAKRGDTRQVYVKKGALMMEVDSSAGLDAAQKVAAIAVRRLP